MSVSLPKVETTLIEGVVCGSSTGFCDLRSKDLSELSAFLIEGSIKLSGYPAFLKQFLSSSSLILSRSWLLIILLNRKHAE